MIVVAINFVFWPWSDFLLLVQRKYETIQYSVRYHMSRLALLCATALYILKTYEILQTFQVYIYNSTDLTRRRLLTGARVLGLGCVDRIVGAGFDRIRHDGSSISHPCLFGAEFLHNTGEDVTDVLFVFVMFCHFLNHRTSIIGDLGSG